MKTFFKIIDFEYLNKYSGMKFWKVLLHFSISFFILFFAYSLPLIFFVSGAEVLISEKENLIFLYNRIGLDGDFYAKSVVFGILPLTFFYLVAMISEPFSKGYIKVKGRWIKPS